MPGKKNTGFTLIEILISILLFSIIISVSFMALNQMVFSFQKQEKIAETQDNMRLVINWTTRDIKAAKEIILQNPDNPDSPCGRGTEEDPFKLILEEKLENGTPADVRYRYYYKNGIFYRKKDAPGAQEQPLTNVGWILNNPPYTDFSPSYPFFEREGAMIKIKVCGGYKEKNGAYAANVMTTEVYRREFELGEGG